MRFYHTELPKKLGDEGWSRKATGSNSVAPMEIELQIFRCFLFIAAKAYRETATRFYFLTAFSEARQEALIADAA